MKISHVSETITVIELSAEEMSQYDFTFEKNDYSSPHTRRVLWSIIDDASRITGKTVEVSRGLEIDFLPDIKGGGLLIISEGEDENIKGYFLPTESVFQSDSIDNIIDFARCVLPFVKADSSSLYVLNGTYRLRIKSLTGIFYFMAGEFSLEDVTSPHCAEATAEGFCCLIENNALEVLGGAASEK